LGNGNNGSARNQKRLFSDAGALLRPYMRMAREVESAPQRGQLTGVACWRLGKPPPRRVFARAPFPRSFPSSNYSAASSVTKPPLRSNVICRPAEIPGDGSAIPQASEHLGRESGGVDVDELAPHFGLAHQYLLLGPLDAETAGMVRLELRSTIHWVATREGAPTPRAIDLMRA